MQNADQMTRRELHLAFCILRSLFCVSSAGVAQQRQQQFRKLPGKLPHESASLSAGSSFWNGVIES